LDLNASQALDPEDQVLSRQAVCNGDNGLTTLLAMTRVSIDSATCAAGAGLQINSGFDLDGNGELEPSEYQKNQLLCDGRDGAMGSAGPAGHDGANFQMQALVAAPALCPAGGSTLLMALDINHNGFYSAGDPEQQSLTLCNGENAPPTAYSPVAAIRPCGDTVPYKEVLLRLANGQILGSFSNDTNGTMTRLSFLPDGTFMDTDGSSCAFSLSTSADHLSRSISWSGSVQEQWLVHY
jgi:hypothetical protein